MRVYIPASADDLAVHTSGQWEPLRGFAVTDALRDSAPEMDDEELAEYAIDSAAMASALELGSRLRTVIAADFSRADVTPGAGEHPGALTINGRLDPDSIACVFLDEDDAGADVAAARAGDEEAQERLAERTLLWYDLREVVEA